MRTCAHRSLPRQAFALCVAAMVHYSGTAARLYHGGFLVFSLLTAVAVATLAVDTRSPLSRLLSIRPLPWIGRISYGLYLWHWLIDVWLNADRVSWGVWPLFAVRTAIAFAIATASYYLVERPIRNAQWNHLQRPRLATVGSLVCAGALVALLCWGIGPGLNQAGADQVVNQLAHPDRATSGCWWSATRWPGRSATASRSCAAWPSSTTGASAAGCSRAPSWWATTPSSRTPTRAARSNRRPGRATSVPARRGARELGCVGGLRPHLPGPRLSRPVRRLPQAAGRADDRAPRLPARPHHRPDRAARHALANEPQYRIGDGDNPRDDISRVDWFNSVQDEVVARQPHQVSVLRWSSWLCPGRNFLEFQSGVKVRPDGLHFQHDTAPLAWDWLTPRLDAIVKASGGRTR